MLDNASGEWLAWEGSGDYADAEHGGTINGPLALRQPGSALKPFTYALAFESGFTPASVLADVPSHFPTAEEGVLYSPRNYDGRFRGPLLARRALAGSENVPAVVLASELGVPALQRFLTRAGISTLDRTPSYYGLGLTLGNAEVRLDELVAAYSSFARRGDWIEPTWIPRGDADQARRQAFVSPLTAYWITDVLSDDSAREYIFGRGGSLEFPFNVAVKTGTSQAYHDNWTVGYTRDVTIGVWVGNFDRTPLKIVYRRHWRRADLSCRDARRHAPHAWRRRVRCPPDCRRARRSRRSRGLRALRHACESVVSGAAARASPGRGRPAVQLASSG